MEKLGQMATNTVFSSRRLSTFHIAHLVFLTFPSCHWYKRDQIPSTEVSPLGSELGWSPGPHFLLCRSMDQNWPNPVYSPYHFQLKISFKDQTAILTYYKNLDRIVKKKSESHTAFPHISHFRVLLVSSPPLLHNT